GNLRGAVLHARPHGQPLFGLLDLRGHLADQPRIHPALPGHRRTGTRLRFGEGVAFLLDFPHLEPIRCPPLPPPAPWRAFASSNSPASARAPSPACCCRTWAPTWSPSIGPARSWATATTSPAAAAP